MACLAGELALVPRHLRKEKLVVFSTKRRELEALADGWLHLGRGSSAGRGGCGCSGCEGDGGGGGEGGGSCSHDGMGWNVARGPTRLPAISATRQRPAPEGQSSSSGRSGSFEENFAL